MGAINKEPAIGEDAARVGMSKAKGVKEFSNGTQSGEGSGAEDKVEGEGPGGVDTDVVLKAEELLMEVEACIATKGGSHRYW